MEPRQAESKPACFPGWLGICLGLVSIPDSVERQPTIKERERGRCQVVEHPTIPEKSRKPAKPTTAWRIIPLVQKYSLLKKIGKGGFAEVWLAKHKSSAEMVAIKVVQLVHPELNPEEMSTLLSESKYLRSLDCPYLLHCAHVAATEEWMVMVLEYMAGGELFDHLYRVQHYSEAEAAKLFAQIVSAVSYLHNLNIMHRDIKPENVMFVSPVECCEAEGRPLRVKLIDLGMAAMYDEKKPPITVVGTPGFIAPEVWNELPQTPAADIYSLGVLLFIMLTGRKPHSHYDTRRMDYCKKSIKDAPGMRDERYLSLSPCARELLLSMLADDPRNRPSALAVLRHPFITAVDSNRQAHREMGEQVRKRMRDLNRIRRLHGLHYALRAQRPGSAGGAIESGGGGGVSPQEVLLSRLDRRWLPPPSGGGGGRTGGGGDNSAKPSGGGSTSGGGGSRRLLPGSGTSPVLLGASSPPPFPKSSLPGFPPPPAPQPPAAHQNGSQQQQHHTDQQTHQHIMPCDDKYVYQGGNGAAEQQEQEARNEQGDGATKRERSLAVKKHYHNDTGPLLQGPTGTEDDGGGGSANGSSTPATWTSTATSTAGGDGCGGMGSSCDNDGSCASGGSSSGGANSRAGGCGGGSGGGEGLFSRKEPLPEARRSAGWLEGPRGSEAEMDRLVLLRALRGLQHCASMPGKSRLERCVMGGEYDGGDNGGGANSKGGGAGGAGGRGPYGVYVGATKAVDGSRGSAAANTSREEKHESQRRGFNDRGGGGVGGPPAGSGKGGSSSGRFSGGGGAAVRACLPVVAASSLDWVSVEDAALPHCWSAHPVMYEALDHKDILLGGPRGVGC